MMGLRPPDDADAVFLTRLIAHWALYPGFDPPPGTAASYWEFLGRRFALGDLVEALDAAIFEHPERPATAGQLAGLAKRAAKRRAPVSRAPPAIAASTERAEPQGDAAKKLRALGRQWEVDDDSVPISEEESQERMKALRALMGW